MLSKLRDIIGEKAKSCKPIRRLYTIILNSYEKEWDFWARSKRTAMTSILTGVKDEHIFDLMGKEFANKLLKIIEPDSVVLDLGCGIGRVEKFLVPYCKEVHGVDVSTRMVKLAKRRLKNLKGVYFRKNNGRDLSIFPDEKFDFVFSVLVLQHMEKEDAYFYIMEFYRILKNAGKVYLQFPNLLYDENINKFFDYIKKYKHRSVARIRWYTPVEVKKIMERIGFEIISLTTNSSIFVLASKRKSSAKENA